MTPKPALSPVEGAPECPNCRRAVLLRDQNPCFPFCGDRCKAIDLGRWLGAEYRIPVTSTDDDDDGSAPPETPLDA